MSFSNGRGGAGDAPPTIDLKRESRVRHVAKALLEAGLITALTFGLIAGSTFAAKGGGTGGGRGGHGGGGSTGGSGTLTLRMVTDANGDGAPNWGDTITFDVSTAATTEPHVDVKCRQGGVVVYSATTGYYASYPWPWTNNMTLSSQAWTGGSANCTATLQAYSGSSVSTLGSLSFTAGA